MKKIREIKIGKIQIGGDHPVAVQTMWDKPIDNVTNELISAVNKLETFGCKIIRFAAPTIESVPLLGEIADRINMPLVADIHFDYKIAKNA